MSNLILKGELSTTQLTFNVLKTDNEILNYNFENFELFICGSLSFFDGMH